MLDRVDAITAASLNYPHPPAFSDAVVACDSEGPEPRNPCFAQATVVRYRRRGARAAGYRGEALAQGIWITRARRLRGQELVEVRPGIRIAFMNALSNKQCEGATTVIKAAIRKELAKRE